VLKGDAFELVKEVESSSVDLILTSPPYWGLRSYGLNASREVLSAWVDAGCHPDRTPSYDWYKQEGGVLGLEPFPRWYVDHLVEFFSRARRVLKDRGSLWVNLGDTYFARWSSIRDGGRQGIKPDRSRRRTPSGGFLKDKQLLLIPARFAIAMQDAGWILRNDVIWAKPNVMPRPESDRLKLSHEHFFHFVKSRPGGRASYHYDLSLAEKGHRDVVVCTTARGAGGHSATFPVELIRPRISTSCPPRGLVLDPFCGSGRAVTEAVRMGRRAIGFELVAGFALAAQSALATATNGVPAHTLNTDNSSG